MVLYESLEKGNLPLFGPLSSGAVAGLLSDGFYGEKTKTGYMPMGTNATEKSAV